MEKVRAQQEVTANGGAVQEGDCRGRFFGQEEEVAEVWCLDGGKCATVTLDKSSGLEKQWYSLSKMEDEIGVEEMLLRLIAGTLKYRKNPEDPKFYQFQKLSEKEATWLTKTKQARKEVVAGAPRRKPSSLISSCLKI